jgi:DNA invertase Pin-like site-specific DNA recombinase
VWDFTYLCWNLTEVQISSRKKPHQRGIDGMLERLAPGDRLIVSELSRLGRSLGQVIHIVDELVKRVRELDVHQATGSALATLCFA